MLLEAFVVSHHAAFLGSLYVATLSTHVVELSAEYLVLAQLAFQTSVVQRCTQRRFQTNLVETFFPVAQYPCLVIYELMLQSLANHLIESQQVGSRDTFSIGRIRNDDALLLRLGEVSEILLLNGNLLAQTGSLHVGSGNGYGRTTDVVAVNMVLEGMLLTVVLIDLIEKFLVEVRPFLKGIFLSVHTGSNASGYQCSLYGDGTASAHRVDKVALPMPTRQHDDTGCQHLVQGSLYTLLTITSAMQALA